MTHVLLAMDFQRGIVGRLTSGEAVVAVAARAVAAARAAGVPVLFVRVAFRPGYPEVVSSPAFSTSVAQAAESMTETNEATALHPVLARRDDEPLVTKRRVSAFTGSDLGVLLRAYDAKHLVLTGISTSGVVLSTVRQAADLDFRLTVLSDACGDRDAQVHQVLTEKVFPRQATVTSSTDWIASIS